MQKRRLAGIAAATTVALLGAGIALSGGSSAAATGGGSTGAPIETTYLALGDSYSSGEGNPPFDPGTDAGPDTCRRSQSAWPRLLDDGDATISLVALFACSGATTAAVTTTPFKTEQPQVDQLAAQAEQPDLITVTIGGNDVGFGDILTKCYISGDPVCVERLDEARTYIKKTLPGRLRHTYKAIHRKARNARIVVVGYPNIMNTAEADALDHCPWLQPAGWHRFIKVAKQLDKAIASAAARAGVDFNSVLGSLAGHEMCTADSWIFAIGPVGGQLRGHPTLKGQQAIANDMYAYLHSVVTSRPPWTRRSTGA